VRARQGSSDHVASGSHVPRGRTLVDDTAGDAARAPNRAAAGETVEINGASPSLRQPVDLNTTRGSSPKSLRLPSPRSRQRPSMNETSPRTTTRRARGHRALAQTPGERRPPKRGVEKKKKKRLARLPRRTRQPRRPTQTRAGRPILAHRGRKEPGAFVSMPDLVSHASRKRGRRE